jgi:hypothetical protein
MYILEGTEATTTGIRIHIIFASYKAFREWI